VNSGSRHGLVDAQDDRPQSKPPSRAGALATAADMKHVFQAALSDPSEAVRDRAAQILALIGAGDEGGRSERSTRSH